MAKSQKEPEQTQTQVDTSPEATVPNVSPDDGHQVGAARNMDDELSFVPDQNTVVPDPGAIVDNAVDNSHVDTAAEREGE